MEPTQAPTPTRPNRRDEAILQKAAEKLLPAVKEWLEENGAEDEDDTILHDIVSAIRWEDDGYKIASHLERVGWDPDSGLVEVFDSASEHIRRAHNAACEEWVKAYKLEEPALQSRVIWPSHPEHGVGTVTRNDPDGRAAVAFDSDTQKSRCYIIEWENLKPATADTKQDVPTQGN